MAKHLLLSFLTDSLGEYVDNLTMDSVRMGVMDGVLEFHNLHLKPMALARLSLPFIVDDAIIKYLKIVIPWTNLGGGIPVQLTVDGVYVKIRPLDYGSLSKEEMQERSRQLRLAILRRAEALAMEAGLQNLFSMHASADDAGDARAPSSSSSSSSSSSAPAPPPPSSVSNNNTYLQRLVSKILANIEVNLRNFHFRYEDSRTLAGQTISAGCTLDELLVVSTDADWTERAAPGGNSGGSNSSSGNSSSSTHPALPERDPEREPRYKIAALRNLAAYWNTDCEPLRRGTPANPASWEQPMAGLIYKQAIGDIQASDGEKLSYLLAPPNCMHLRLADRSSCPLTVLTRAEPRLDLEADQNSALGLSFDSTQLLQLCLVLDSFAAAERQKMLILFRPLERPTKDPRAWWVYAYRLVTGRDDMLMRSLSAATVKTCLASRSRYVALAKRRLDKEDSPQHAAFLACMAELSVSMLEKRASLSAQMERQFMKMTQTPGVCSLSSSEAAEMLALESVIPLPALIVYRQLAVRELLESAKRKSNKKALKEVERTEKQVLGGSRASTLTKMRNFFRYGSSAEPVGVAPALDEGAGEAADDAKSAGPAEPDATSVSGPKAQPPPGKKSVFSKMFGAGKGKEEQGAAGGTGEAHEAARSSSMASSSTGLDGDIEMDVLRAGFGEELWGEAAADNAAAALQGGDIFLLRLAARLDVQVRLFYEGRPLLDAKLALGLQVGTRSASDMKIRLAVTEMNVEDRLTMLPVRPYLLSYLETSEAAAGFRREPLGQKEKLVCEWDHGPVLSTLRVWALPLEIVWNAQCVTGVIDMFVTPLSVLSPWPLVPMASYQLLSHSPVSQAGRPGPGASALPALGGEAWGRSSEKGSEKSSEKGPEGERDPRGALQIIVDMEAPKIIIPADSCREDCGFVVLDMGSLAFRATLRFPLDGDDAAAIPNKSRRGSSVAAPAAEFRPQASQGPEFSWRLSLTDFCASISSSSHDIYACAARGGHVYLINPLRINLSCDRADAGDAATGLTYPPQAFSGRVESFVLIEPSPRMLVQVNAASLGHLVDVIARLVEDVEIIKAITKRADLRRTRRSSAFLVLDDRKAFPEKSRAPGSSAVLQLYLDLLSEHTLLELLRREIEKALESFFLPKRDPALASALVTIHLSELQCDVLYGQDRGSKNKAHKGGQVEAVQELESISILLSVIVCEIAVRPYDLVMQYSVGRISVDDSLRPLPQRYLVRFEDLSEAGSPPAALVKVNQSFDPRSPNLTTQGLDVLLSVQGVVLAVDASAILHAHSVSQVLVERLSRLSRVKSQPDKLGPLAQGGSSEAFVAAAEEARGLAQTDSEASFSAMPSMSSSQSSLAQDPEVQDSPGRPGRRHGVSADNLSTESPTRLRRASNASSIHTRHRGSVIVGMARRHVILEEGHLAALAELDYKRLCMTICSVQLDVFKCHEGEEGRDSQPLDPVCSLVLSSVRGAMDTRELIAAQLLVAHMSMTDERVVASNFTFRTMLDCAPTGGAGVSGGAGPGAEKSALVVTYSENNASSHLLDVALFSVLSTFALDTLMDTSNVAVNIAFAVLTVITPPDADAVYRYEEAPRALGYNGGDQENEDENDDEDDEYGADDDILVEDVTVVNDEEGTPENTPGFASYIPPPPEARAWNICVHLPDPCVVLLDDPLVELTRCLVATLTIDAHCGIDTWGSVLSEKQEAAHLTAQAIEVYALPDAGAYLLRRREEGAEAARWALLEPRCVCEKFSADFHATRRLEQGIVLAANIALRMSDITAELSLENMHILDSILSRRVLTGLAPSKQIHNVTYCIFGARDGKAGTQVDIYVLALSMGNLTITAVNDLVPAFTQGAAEAGAEAARERRAHPGDKKAAYPARDHRKYPNLLRVQFSGASFHGNGALHPRLLVNNVATHLEVDVHHVEGSGFLVASLDFFNPHVRLWEPVVELWRPELLVKKGHQGMLIEVTAPRTLQINLSGRMIDGVMKAYSLLLQRAENFRFVKRDTCERRDSMHEDPPLLLLDEPAPARDRTQSRNQLGTDAPHASLGTFFGPGVLVLNRLLCDVEYRLVQAGKHFMRRESEDDYGRCIQEGTVEPGLGDGVRLDPTKKGMYSVVFRASSFAWSPGLAVAPDKDALYTLDMPSQAPDRAPLVLRVHATLVDGAGGPVLELSVFISAAMIDRTGLRLSSRAARKRQPVVRSAHASGQRQRNELCERLRALECERRFRRESMHARPAPTVFSSGDDSESPAPSLDGADDEEAAAESKEEYYRLQTAESSAPLIAACAFDSRRDYRFSPAAKLHTPVYSDRDLEWTHLPCILLEQAQLRTPCDDYAVKASALVRFTPSREVLVMVLIDAGSVTDSTPPTWMQREGYRRAVDSSIARETSTPHPAQHHFLAWGKLFAADKEVVLGSSEACGRCGMHYTAFVVDPLTLNLLADGVAETIEQVTQSAGTIEDIREHWLHGERGLCYFHADDDKVAFGIPGSRRAAAAATMHWSDDVSLSATTHAKGGVDVVNKDTQRSYQLCYSVAPLPGLFNRTRVVTVTPHYCIVNCMDEPVELRQQGLGTEEVLFIEPFRSSPWHKTNYKCSTKVHLRALSTLWSYGCIDINEVGSSVVLLPSASWFQASANHDAVVAHVEVKLAEPSDNCAVCVVIWKSSKERGSMISIKNDSDLPVTIQQAGVFVPPAEHGQPIVLGSSIKNTIAAPPQRPGEMPPGPPSPRAVSAPLHEDEGKFSVCVAPGIWQPFGWADPESAPIITVTIGTPPHGPVQICTTLGLLRLNEVVKLMTSEAAPRPRKAHRRDRDKGEADAAAGMLDYSCVYIAVQALGSGRVVRIVRNESDLSTSVRVSTDEADDVRKPISKTATGAIVGGVVVGSLILGPIAGALLAGAGIYAVSRSVQKGKKKKKDKERRHLHIADRPRDGGPSEESQAQVPGQDGAAPESSNAQAPGPLDPAPPPTEEAKREDQGQPDDLSAITADYSAAVCFRFASLSFSLTVEKPTRRELLSLFVEKIEGNMRVSATARSFELSVKDVQLDTYSETSLYPVVLHAIRDDDRYVKPYEF